MTICWTEKSQRRMEGIYSFISHVNERAAVETYNAILDKAELLSSFPQIARIEPLLVGASKQFRALLVKKLYKVIYYIEGETIYIATVWDCRRNPVALVTEVEEDGLGTL